MDKENDENIAREGLLSGYEWVFNILLKLNVLYFLHNFWFQGRIPLRKLGNNRRFLITLILNFCLSTTI